MMERIQKYIASCGVMSRRAAEKEIAAGNVTVNGVRAEIGQAVSDKDVICFHGERIRPEKRKITVMLNKPSGYVTTMSDEMGRKTVNDLVDLPERLYPAGRLDKDSEGLLIMTNDGELANRLTHPKSGKKKIYHVYLRGSVDNNALDMLRAMKTLDGEKINPVGVELIKRSPTGSVVKFTLTEGKNRQIRRMCEAAGVTVTQLKRVQIGSLRLGDLKTGQYRKLTDKEKEELLK
ncbi:MAG: rRNA pseudouridine synthase [Clostridia bacterium]|nr:rRNA pseudouridine synthase [Clostridia bacterium]